MTETYQRAAADKALAAWESSKRERESKRLRLEPGHTYLTRNGRAVRVLNDTGRTGTHAYVCEVVDTGALTWRSATGRFDKRPSRLDLVLELAA